MWVDDEIRKCVVFIAVRKADDSFVLKGTAFFVVRPAGDGNTLSYLVTARHVIEGVKDLGLEHVYVRMNTKDGSLGYASTSISQWIFPKDSTIDLALCPAGLPSQFNHKLLHTSLFADDLYLKTNEVNVGDEVVVTGLFKHHHGDNANIPIVRVGNIAAMPIEPVQTKDCRREAYLIECRSIGGLSGSPVFTNLGYHRYIGGVLKTWDGKPSHSLIGVIQGHYDTYESGIDLAVDDTGKEARVNSGIAIVTPVSKLISFFEEDTVVAMDNQRISQMSANAAELTSD